MMKNMITGTGGEEPQFRGYMVAAFDFVEISHRNGARRNNVYVCVIPEPEDAGADKGPSAESRRSAEEVHSREDDEARTPFFAKFVLDAVDQVDSA